MHSARVSACEDSNDTYAARKHLLLQLPTVDMAKHEAGIFSARVRVDGLSISLLHVPDSALSAASGTASDRLCTVLLTGVEVQLELHKHGSMIPPTMEPEPSGGGYVRARKQAYEEARRADAPFAARVCVGALELIDERDGFAAPLVSEVGSGADDIAKSAQAAQAKATSAMAEAEVSPPWLSEPSIGFLHEGMHTVLHVRAVSTDESGEQPQAVDACVAISRLRLPIKPILLTQVAEGLVPALSQSVALAAVESDRSDGPNPAAPMVICPVRLSVEVDGLMTALALPGGQQLVSSHTLTLRVHLASSTQEELTTTWEFDALLCPRRQLVAAASHQDTMSAEAKAYDAQRSTTSAASGDSGPSQESASAAAASLLLRAQPLLPQCSLQFSYELGDTHGAHHGMANAARAAARSIVHPPQRFVPLPAAPASAPAAGAPAGESSAVNGVADRARRVFRKNNSKGNSLTSLWGFRTRASAAPSLLKDGGGTRRAHAPRLATGRAFVDSEWSEASRRGKSHASLRQASLQVKRVVVLLPPAHVLALSRTLAELGDSLAPQCARLSDRSGALLALLSKPPPVGGMSLSDHLPFVLPGSPALDAATQRMQLRSILAVVDPDRATIKETMEAMSVRASAKLPLPQTLPAPSSIRRDALPQNKSPRPHTHLSLRLQRVRIFLCDDFSVGGRNDPTVELHLAEGHAMARLSPSGDVRAEGGAAVEVRGLSQRARLWEPLLENTLVCVHYSRLVEAVNEGGESAVADVTANRSAGVVAPFTHRLRVMMPRRVNVTLTQQYLRLARQLQAFVQAYSNGPIPVPRDGADETFLETTRLALPPSLPHVDEVDPADSLDEVGGTPWDGGEMWLVNELGATVWIRSTTGSAPWALPTGARVRLGKETVVLPADGDSHCHVAAVRTPGLPLSGLEQDDQHEASGRASGRVQSPEKTYPALRRSYSEAAGKLNSSLGLATFHPPVEGELPRWRWGEERGSGNLRDKLQGLRRALDASTRVDLERRLWNTIFFARRRAQAAEEAQDSSDSELELSDSEDERIDHASTTTNETRASTRASTSSRQDSRKQNSKKRSAIQAHCLPFSVMSDALTAPLYAVGHVLLRQEEQSTRDVQHSSPTVLVHAERMGGQSSGSFVVLQPSFALSNRTGNTLCLAVRLEAVDDEQPSGQLGDSHSQASERSSSGRHDGAGSTLLSLEQAATLIEGGYRHFARSSMKTAFSSAFNRTSEGPSHSRLLPGSKLSVPLPLLMYPNDWVLYVSIEKLDTRRCTSGNSGAPAPKPQSSAAHDVPGELLRKASSADTEAATTEQVWASIGPLADLIRSVQDPHPHRQLVRATSASSSQSPAGVRPSFFGGFQQMLGGSRGNVNDASDSPTRDINDRQPGEANAIHGVQLAVYGLRKRYSTYQPSASAATWRAAEKSRLFGAQDEDEVYSLDPSQRQRKGSHIGALSMVVGLKARVAARKGRSEEEPASARESAAADTTRAASAKHAHDIQPEASKTKRASVKTEKAHSGDPSARRGSPAGQTGFEMASELFFSPGLQMLSSLPYLLQIQIGYAAHFEQHDEAPEGSADAEAVPMVTLMPGGEGSVTHVDCCAPGLLVRSRMRLPKRDADASDAEEGSYIWCGWSAPIELLPLQADVSNTTRARTMSEARPSTRRSVEDEPSTDRATDAEKSYRAASRFFRRGRGRSSSGAETSGDADRSECLLELAAEAAAMESDLGNGSTSAVAAHSETTLAVPLPVSAKQTGASALFVRFRRRVNAAGSLLVQIVSHTLLVNRTGLELALKLDDVDPCVTTSGHTLPSTLPAGPWAYKKGPTSQPSIPLMLPPAHSLSIAVPGPGGVGAVVPGAWSQPIDLRDVGIRGQVLCGDYQLGCALSNAPPPFDPCVVVTLTPRFLVRNLIPNRAVRVRNSLATELNTSTPQAERVEKSVAAEDGHQVLPAAQGVSTPIHFRPGCPHSLQLMLTLDGPVKNAEDTHAVDSANVNVDTSTAPAGGSAKRVQLPKASSPPTAATTRVEKAREKVAKAKAKATVAREVANKKKAAATKATAATAAARVQATPPKKRKLRLPRRALSLAHTREGRKSFGFARERETAAQRAEPVRWSAGVRCDEVGASQILVPSELADEQADESSVSVMPPTPVRRASRLLGESFSARHITVGGSSGSSGSYEVAEVQVAEDVSTACIFITLRQPAPSEVALLLRNETAHALLVTQHKAPITAPPIILASHAEMPWAWLDPSAEPSLLVQPILSSTSWNARREMWPVIGVAKGASSPPANEVNNEQSDMQNDAAIVLQTAMRKRLAHEQLGERSPAGARRRVGAGIELSTTSIGVLPSLRVGGDEVHVALELRNGVKLLRFGPSPFTRPAPLPQGWLLRVRVISAVGLKASDFGVHGFTSDPFVEVSCGGQRRRTSTVKHSLNPTWNETIELRFREPPEYLVLKLYDRDRFSQNDELGHVVLALNRLWQRSDADEIAMLRGGGLGQVARRPVLYTMPIADSNGQLQFEVLAQPTDKEVSPLTFHLNAVVSSVGLSLVDVPDHKPPSEVLYVQLQRLRTRVEMRRDSSQATARIGTIHIDHTANQGAPGTLWQQIKDDAVLAPDLLQLLVLLQHTPGSQPTVETIEILLQALELRVREETIVDALRVLLPLLLSPPLPQSDTAATAKTAPAASKHLVPGALDARDPLTSWEQLARPFATDEQLRAQALGARGARDAEPIYMRLVHIGALQSTLSYTAGRRGLLSQMLDSVLEKERAHFVAASVEGGGVGGSGGSGVGGHGSGDDGPSQLTELIRGMSTVAGRIPDMDGMALKFNELVVTDAFTSYEQLLSILQAHYTRISLRRFFRLIGSARILGNPAALLDKVCASPHISLLPRPSLPFSDLLSCALLDKLGGGVIEFFRAPADGFISDGLVGLGLGFQKGIEALVLGAASGLFESLQRMTGAFCKLAGSLGGINVDVTTSDPLGRPVDAAVFAREIAAAYKDVVMKPYTGARTGGVVGFGKGLVSATAGLVAVKIALALGSISLGLAAAASRAEKKRVERRNKTARRYGPAAEAAERPIRRPREFGVHGQILPYTEPHIDAEHHLAARLILRRWREGVQRRLEVRERAAAQGANPGAPPGAPALELVPSLRTVVRHAAHARVAKRAADRRARGFSLVGCLRISSLKAVLSGPPKPQSEPRELRDSLRDHEADSVRV